jgi:hypothetical protein
MPGRRQLRRYGACTVHIVDVVGWIVWIQNPAADMSSSISQIGAASSGAAVYARVSTPASVSLLPLHGVLLHFPGSALLRNGVCG